MTVKHTLCARVSHWVRNPTPTICGGMKIQNENSSASWDDVYYDAERKRIYAIGGEGFISVVQQNDADHYTLSANIPSAVGVRTGIFYGTSLYVGVPASGLEPAQIWNYGVPE